MLGDLVGFAHERYSDAIKSSGAVVDHLRLVAAAEAFQTMSAVQQIAQAVNSLEQTLGDIEYWSKEAQQLTLDRPLPEPDELEPLKLPRALLMSSDEPPIQHGFWEKKGEYAIELGGRPDLMVEVSVAGPDQVVAPKRGIVLDVTGGPVVLEELEWNEIARVADWLLNSPPSALGGEAEK